ncbi:mCG144515, partial [Mus musculus]
GKVSRTQDLFSKGLSLPVLPVSVKSLGYPSFCGLSPPKSVIILLIERIEPFVHWVNHHHKSMMSLCPNCPSSVGQNLSCYDII